MPRRHSTVAPHEYTLFDGLTSRTPTTILRSLSHCGQAAARAGTSPGV